MALDGGSVRVHDGASPERRLIALLLTLLLATPALAQPGPGEEAPIPAVPMDDGHGVTRVLDVRPFRLVEGTWTYDFRAGAPRIRSGHLAVLRGRPALVQPREVRSAVLYAGPVPVHVVARDVASGCVAGVLPPDVDADTAPFYFGSWELPERVDALRGAAEARAARALGIGPRPEAERAAWSRQPVEVASPEALTAELRAMFSACTHLATDPDRSRSGESR